MIGDLVWIFFSAMGTALVLLIAGSLSLAFMGFAGLLSTA